MCGSGIKDILLLLFGENTIECSVSSDKSFTTSLNRDGLSGLHINESLNSDIGHGVNSYEKHVLTDCSRSATRISR